jgi:hypothetical protein
MDLCALNTGPVIQDQRSYVFQFHSVSQAEGNNGKPYRENVGLENKNGTPTGREEKARQDIENVTGQCAFTSYRCAK